MDATLSKEGPRYTLMVERRLTHSPEKVWRAVTERDALRRWFPSDVEGAWEVGASLKFAFLHGDHDGLTEDDMRGEVIAVDEPRLLEFRWGAHYLKYELEPDGDGCLFRLSESFADPSWGARNAAGWEMCLDNLGLVLDGAAALEFVADVWTAKFKRYVAAFEPEFGPQHDPTGEHPLLKEDGPAS
ncbi:MAG: SRPBCC family protein [Longimicrobiales bacterium]